MYGDFGVISSIKMDGVLYINSGTVNNDDFTFSMQKHIIKLINSENNVIMMAIDYKRVGHVFKKLNFRYNNDKSFFYKGVI